MGLSDLISTFVDRSFARETAFLAELVKVASDNPPGDCAPHAARAKTLLEGLGLKVEAHPVPPDLAQACGTVSATKSGSSSRLQVSINRLIASGPR